MECNFITLQRRCSYRFHLRWGHLPKQVFSLFAGWWGVPFGLFATPTQIVRNLIAPMLPWDVPSPDFRRAMLFDLVHPPDGRVGEDRVSASADSAVSVNS